METTNVIADEDTQEVMVELPRITTILENVWQSIKKLLPQLWVATAILYILQLPQVLFSESSANIGVEDLTELLLLMLSSSMSALFAVALVHYIVQLYIDPETAALQGSVRWLGRHLFTILVLMALAFGITLTGIFFLIVPALIFAVYNMFSYIVLVREEKRSPVNYIVRSTELVYGAFWPLLGRVVAVLLIAWVLLSIVGFFASAIAAAMLGFLPYYVLEAIVFGIAIVVQVVGIIATVSLLLQLYDVRYAQTVDQPQQLPVKRLRAIYRMAAVIGWLGLLTVMLGLFVMFASSLLTI